MGLGNKKKNNPTTSSSSEASAAGASVPNESDIARMTGSQLEARAPHHGRADARRASHPRLPPAPPESRAAPSPRARPSAPAQDAAAMSDLSPGVDASWDKSDDTPKSADEVPASHVDSTDGISLDQSALAPPGHFQPISPADEGGAAADDQEEPMEQEEEEEEDLAPTDDELEPPAAADPVPNTDGDEALEQEEAAPAEVDQPMAVDEPTAAGDSSEDVAAPSAQRKKRRSKPLHNKTKDSAEEATKTTGKSPATALKGRKQKQIEVGSSAAESLEEEEEEEEEGADVPMGDEDEDEAGAGSSKSGGKSGGEPSKRRKKKLQLSESGDGQKESKSKKGKRAEADEAPAKKQKKDPNLPKKARSAFTFFSIDERKSPDVSALSFGEQGKAISLSWKAISAADRKPYDEMNKEDVARYARDVEAYEAEHGPLPKPARKQKEPKEPAASKRGGSGASKSDASKSKVVRKSKARGGSSSLASIAEEDEESDGGDAAAGVGIGGGRRSQRMPPELDESTLLPRARHPMRDEAFGVGDQLAWIPQAYDEFAQAYGTTLRKLSIPQLPHALEGSLMGAPADGTANAAEVVGVSEPTEFAPGVAGLDGWRLLRLKQVAMPGAPEGRGVDGAAPAEYNLPVLRRALCDVDQHTCELARYVDSRRWRPGTTKDSQICVRFAAPPDAADDVDGAEEEEWEGRVWDVAPHEPNAYPDSMYKRLRVIYYVKSKHPDSQDEPPSLTNTTWILDPEQTDTEVSPWEAAPSSSHGAWAKKFSALASTSKPLVLDRADPRKLVPQPESEDVDMIDGLGGGEAGGSQQEGGGDGDALAAVAEQAVLVVMKRLASNEASKMLWCPVPTTEVAYHSYLAEIGAPAISLGEIAANVDAGKYAGGGAWRAFADDMQQLVSNAHGFNDDDTVWFHLASMLEKEVLDATAHIRQIRPALLGEA